MRKHIPSVRTFVLLFLGLCLSAGARANDNNVTVYKVSQGNAIYLMARLSQCTEVSITFTATLNNMVSSVPLPQTVALTGPKTTVLAIFTPISASAPCSCLGSYFWEYGRMLTATPTAYSYLLPYRDGPYQVIQGAHGAFSHTIGTADAEAIDFAMPVGTKIYAARAGTVIAFRSDSMIGGPDKKWTSEANYVIIKHDDGTLAEYLHIQHNGVLVHLGDRVTTDQAIALSGNTGYTTEPHLHFAVFTVQAGSTSRSLPIVFQRLMGPEFTPSEGSYY
jgi:hypothetical protein